MSDCDKNLTNNAALQLGGTTEHRQRPVTARLAEAIARHLAQFSKKRPRGAGRQSSLGIRFVFGRSDNPEHDRPAERHSDIVNQFFGQFGIRVMGFGFDQKTWCVLVGCPDVIHDDLLENVVNAAWQAATHGNQHPLKRAKAQVKRRLDCASQMNSATRDRKERSPVCVSRFIHGIDFGGVPMSMTVVKKDLISLIPRADRVALVEVDADAQPTRVVAQASWDRVAEVLGDEPRPIEGYPVRYRVGEFPSDEQLRRIGHA